MNKIIRFSIPFILACLFLGMIFFLVRSSSQVAAAPSPSTPEGTIMVNTLLDENDGSCSDSDCSLRDAIQVAAAGDTITFNVAGTIVLTLGQLNVDKDLTISGPGSGSLTVDGNHNSTIFYVTGASTNFSGLTIANGFCFTGCGGVGKYNSGTTTLTNVIISGNTLSLGGGGGICNTGTATLTNVNISSNYAFNGGGMLNTGTTTLTNVNINANSTFANLGGGLYNSGTATLTNVTISGNTVGGGMYNTGISTLTNVTISGNHGGGIYIGGTSSLNLKNTLLAGNTDSDCSGTLASDGYNLIQNINSCTITGSQTGNIYGEDPLLGPLQNNGGSTLTHALLWNSPAIDAGDNAQYPLTDQRGVPRPLDGDNDGIAVYDIGAYEREYQPIIFLPLVNK